MLPVPSHAAIGNSWSTTLALRARSREPASSSQLPDPLEAWNLESCSPRCLGDGFVDRMV
jgi:hypothetical protein